MSTPANEKKTHTQHERKMTGISGRAARQPNDKEREKSMGKRATDLHIEGFYM